MLVLLAAAIVGVSFGAITVSVGLPFWLPLLLSVAVFAGAAQFAFVGILAAGGTPLAAAVAGLLINARHIPFGFAVADAVGTRTIHRVIGSHLMIDEAVAFAQAQDDPKQRRAVYWASGIGMFACWNLGVLAGAFGGTIISDTDALGLDAAFPAVLLALVLPSLSDRPARRAAVAGVVIALAAAPFVPAGLPVLLALTGLLVGWRPFGRDASNDRKEVAA